MNYKDIVPKIKTFNSLDKLQQQKISLLKYIADRQKDIDVLKKSKLNFVKKNIINAKKKTIEYLNDKLFEVQTKIDEFNRSSEKVSETNNKDSDNQKNYDLKLKISVLETKVKDLTQKISNMNSVDNQDTSIKYSEIHNNEYPSEQTDVAEFDKKEQDEKSNIGLMLTALLGGAAILSWLQSMGSLGIGALKALTYFVKGFKNIITAPAKFTTWILSNIKDKVLEWTSDLISPIKKLISSKISTVKEYIKKITTPIYDFVKNQIQKLKDVVGNLIKSSIKAVLKPFQPIIDKFKSVKDGVTNAIKKSKDFVSNKIGAVKDTAKGFFSKVSNIYHSAKDTVVNKVSNVYKTAKDTVVKTGKYIANSKVGKVVGKGLSKAKNAIANSGIGKAFKVAVKRLKDKIYPIIGKGLSKIAGKGSAKLILKRIPLVSVLAGLGFGVYELLKGNPIKAALEVASGLATILDEVAFPGAGTALSLYIDNINSGIKGKGDGDKRTALSSIVGGKAKKAQGIQGKDQGIQGKAQGIQGKATIIGEYKEYYDNNTKFVYVSKEEHEQINNAFDGINKVMDADMNAPDYQENIRKAQNNYEKIRNTIISKHISKDISKTPKSSEMVRHSKDISETPKSSKILKNNGIISYNSKEVKKGKIFDPNEDWDTEDWEEYHIKDDSGESIRITKHENRVLKKLVNSKEKYKEERAKIIKKHHGTIKPEDKAQVNKMPKIQQKQQTFNNIQKNNTALSKQIVLIKEKDKRNININNISTASKNGDAYNLF